MNLTFLANSRCLCNFITESEIIHIYIHLFAFISFVLISSAPFLCFCGQQPCGKPYPALSEEDKWRLSGIFE